MAMSAQNWQRDPGGKNAKSPDTQRKIGVGSALRFMYVPRIGRSFGEIGRSNGIFVRMIAGVFMSQGLFPRQHPAFKDASVHLGLGEVIGIAFHNLNWTKEGLPQILFFLAILGTIVFSAIGFFLALGSMFTTQAHAGLLDSPFPLTDAGNKWLEHIFNNGDFTFTNFGTGAQYGLLAADAASMPLSLRAIAAIYSNAMLILASLILIYHLISMVVHTAHEGVAMGRSANQIWAPVRLVFALGLLVPVAGGWSSGQWMVMQIAKWGSGMASNIWFTAGVVNFPPYILRFTPKIRGEAVIAALMETGSCVINQIHKHGADGYSIQGALPGAVTIGVATAPIMFQTRVIPGAGGPGSGLMLGGVNAVANQGFNYSVYAGVLGGPWWWTDSLCGTFSTPDMGRQLGIAGAGAPGSFGIDAATGAVSADAAALTLIRNAYITAFELVRDDAMQLGATMKAGELRTSGYAGLCTYPLAIDCAVAPASSIDLWWGKEALSDLYENTFLGVIGPAIVNIGAVPAEPAPGAYVYDRNTGELIYKSSDPYIADTRGWMSAGMYFIQLASKGALAQRVVSLDVVGSPKEKTGDDGAYKSLTQQVAQVAQEMEGDRPISALGTGQSICAGKDVGANMDLFKKVIYCAAFRPLGLMDDNFQMTTGRKFSGSGQHLPFSDMVNFGQSLVDNATALVRLGLGLQAAAGAAFETTRLADQIETNRITGTDSSDALAKKASIAKMLMVTGFGALKGLVSALATMASMLAPMLITFGVTLFVPGFILFYLLPALPFINFILGCITWLISILQAVIAIPVIAIAHITPNGEGLPSASARGAYIMILQIFLRPVMMIFGLFVCMLLANSGLVFASMLFIDVTNAGMTSGDPLSQLIYFILYASLCYGIVHASITAIDDFPLKAVSWIGGGTVDQNHHHQTATAGMVAGSQMMNQATGALGNMRHGGYTPMTKAQFANLENQTAGQQQQAAMTNLDQRIAGAVATGAITGETGATARNLGAAAGGAYLDKKGIPGSYSGASTISNNAASTGTGGGGATAKTGGGTPPSSPSGTGTSMPLSGK